MVESETRENIFSLIIIIGEDFNARSIVIYNKYITYYFFKI